MAGGRPTKYEDSYPEMLIAHMETGLSFEAFAGLIRVSKASIYKWAAEIPAFSEARSIGQALATLYWEKVARDGMYNEVIKTDDGMTVTRSVNASILIFTLKNRLGWRDRTDAEVTLGVSDEAADKGSELTEKILAAFKCKS